MDSDFPTTAHSLLAQLRSHDPFEKKVALNLFVAGYRKALLKFLIVTKQVNQNDAEDLVQDFILEKIVTGQVLSATPKEGKFRNLLRKCLQNYLIDSLRKRKTQEKNFESNSGLFAMQNIEHEFDVFDELWAKGIFVAVLKQMEARSPYWALFKARVLTNPPLSYSAIVESCGFEDPVKASNALMTAKRTFLRLVSEMISDSVGHSSEVSMDEEIGLLKRVLLDSSEIAAIVDSLDAIQIPASSPSRLAENLLEDQVYHELGTIVDASWAAAENEEVLEHLFASKVGGFLGTDGSVISDQSVKELLFENSIESKSQLDATIKLKHFFKSLSGEDEINVPRPILVTIVFALIARYVQLGGEVAAITSIEVDDLRQRLKSISEKSWVKGELKGLFEAVLS